MGLRENILSDPISAMELRDLVSVRRGTPVRAAAEVMRRKKLGCAIIVDDEGRPVGKFTERKLMKLLLENPRNIDEPVDRFMYPSADAIGQDEPIAEMVKRMQARQLRFFCVVDSQGKAVALTGQKGLMEYIAEHFPRQVKAHLMESKLHMDQREGA